MATAIAEQYRSMTNIRTVAFDEPASTTAVPTAAPTPAASPVATA
jgi:hypothetical protein